ncbi:hypothetical protein BH09GEM1_BH09GEM1_42820 [soil metagenome]
MDHCGVVAPAECITNFNELHSQKLTHEIHRHLPGNGQGFGTGLGSKPLGAYTPFACNNALNSVSTEYCMGITANWLNSQFVSESFSRNLDGNFSMLQRRIGEEFNHGSLKLSYARTHVFSDEPYDVVWNRKLEMIQERLVA